MKVYIDAGHGGKDSGAVGNGMLEKNNVLNVALMLEEACKRCGMSTSLSRRTDVFRELSYRTNEANNWGADVFISLHNNSFSNPDAKGIETWAFMDKYSALAKAVHSELLATGKYTNDRGVKCGDLWVVKKSRMDACLCELGFISNGDDSVFLRDAQRQHAEGICKGICKHKGINYVEPTGSSTQSNGDVVIHGIDKEKADALREITGWNIESK